MADCRTGATAMALLPFLGAGQTHQQGQYKQNVERGSISSPARWDPNEGGTAGGRSGPRPRQHVFARPGRHHPVRSLRHDPRPKAHGPRPAVAQPHHVRPGSGRRRLAIFAAQPGDTSVVGWQLMALKSGHMAYLSVDPRPFTARSNSLIPCRPTAAPAMAIPARARGKPPRPSACSAGCISAGSTRTRRSTRRGVHDATGPSADNMYYNYYATQVMRQYCGDPGRTATKCGRSGTRRCATSSSEPGKNGHAKGSWFIKAITAPTRRPRLLHVDGGDDPRGLLPPHADLW